MIAYEIYKIVHLLSLFFILTTALMFFVASYRMRHFLPLLITSVVMLLVSGMGLLARVGVSHTEGWPLWAKLKLSFWIALSGCLVFFYKRPQKAALVYSLLGLIFTAAVVVIIYKPGM